MASKIHVSLIDADDAIREAVSTALEQRDAPLAVSPFTDADTVVDHVGTDESVDCIVSAYDLPQVSGLELLQTIRDDHPELPFILFTDHESASAARRAFAADVSDICTSRGTTDEYEVLAHRIQKTVREQRLRQELNQTRERYEIAVQAASDIIWERQTDTNRITVSEGIEETFGYSADEEYAFEWWQEHTHPDDQERLKTRLQRAFEAEQDQLCQEYRFRRIDGSYAYVEDTCHISYDSSGAPTRMIGAIRDITEQKEYEQQLERQNERLNEFASVVSHDIRNPLSVAVGNLELATDECDSKFLEQASTALTRIEYLTGDLLTLARSGKAVGETTPVRLRAIAKAAWGNVETATATLDLGTDDTIVEVDRDRLEEAFENLFRNAIEHGGEDITVRVGTINNGFYVEDTGDGIPDDARDQVFDHGYSTGEGGTGFGLSIVRSIIEGHGWSITVADASAGGARFEITDVQLSS
ncbi:hybrid sensor histidine kinase/response regulator [Haloarcula sp. Atlit-7R]|uniref:ATP-binding response regulator n=1 Tax=Haloarcula sp. Atlit-7R TaxID=2282125 RepID=UPI000EF15311|nr:ATP-binding protein [Haloarcula sp. Atlit-7R]RLM89542.1 PAS domain S-box protein [Haloarcula sp. Atlit-7R]